MSFLAEKHMRLMQGFQALSEPMREALRLRAKGLSPSLIGRKLGITTSDARVLLHAAWNTWMRLA